MADVNNLKIDGITPQILFAGYQATPKNYRYDFTKFELNAEANNDIEVYYNKLVVKKFKPNVWILRSPEFTSKAELCESSKNLYVSIRGMSNNSVLFSSSYYHHSVVGGSGGTQGHIRGLGIFPFSNVINGWQLSSYGQYAKNRGELPFSAYVWDALTYTDGTTCQIGSELTAFRGDWGAGYNGYGKIYDSTNVKVIPDYVTFPTPYTTLYLTLGLYTGRAISFEAWECENRINALKMTISQRNADDGSNRSAYCYSGFSTIQIRVSGLSDGDRLEYSSGVTESSDSSITADGEYSITYGEGRGFILYGDTENTSAVTIELINNEYLDEDGYVDISDTPIIIELVMDKGGIDVSTVECWDVKLGEETVYHKDRTRENCWAKYGMLFPEGYDLIPSNLTKSSDNLEWIASNRLKLTKASTTAITLKKASTTVVNTTSTTPSYLGFKVHIWNKPDNVNITFERTFTNMTEDHNVLIALENGTTEVPAFSEKMYLSSVSTTSYLTEFLLTISADEDVDCGIIIELEPIFTEDCYKKMIPNTAWNMLSKLNIPDVVDKTSIDMLRTTWNMKPENTEIWDSIKEWFANNEITDTLLQHPLFQNSNIDEITLNLASLIYENPSRYMYANRPFSGSTVKKINLVSKNGCSFSVGNGLFFGANNLEEITFTPKEDDVQWLVGATDFSGMFSKVYNLKTYPSNLINWGLFRSNLLNFTRYATSMQYFMDYGSLETIPIYNDGDRFADENTIIFGTFADQAFNCGSTLKYIGPVLDLVLVQPSNAKNIFRCEGLTDVRIKNLNHGDWNLDNVTRNQWNGYLPSLDADSVAYLFENLVDLNTSNPEAHEESVKNSFRLWSSDYKYTYQNNEYEYRCELRSLLARKRVAEGGDAPSIAYTNAVLEDIKINVVGLKTGDSLEWGDTIITTNGIHTISHDGSGNKGFKLYGDPSNTTDIVYVHLVNGLDYGNPVQSSANLYCPANWMSMDNAKVAEVFSVKNGGSVSGNVLSISQRMGTYADANTFAYKQYFTCKNLKIKVTGLQEGDTLWLGNLTSGYRCGGVSADGTYSIEEISSSAINLSDEWTYADGTKVSVLVAFALINADTSITDTVTIEFISDGTNETPCYVMSIPYRGELITSDMISAANAKGWTIYVGGYNRLWMTNGYETANKTIELTAKWYGVNITPEWSIDSDVATIEDDVLTFNTSGSVTVTATYEGVSASETFSYVPDSIEYLQTNGGQYVDTGYNPGPTTEIDLDVYLSNEGITSGSMWSTLDDTYVFSCNQGGNNVTNIYYWSPLPHANDNSRIRVISGVTLNQRINLGMKLVDGVRYGYYGDRLSPALLDLEATLSGTIILFASTSGAKWSTDARIYGVTIKEAGEIVRHFVPAINDDGIPCLYEEIEGKYYLSLGEPFIVN